MANFSSFFPAAGGGGGFTKMKKYSTFGSTGESTNKQEIGAPGYTVAEYDSLSGAMPNVRVSAISNGGTSASINYWRIGTSFWSGYADLTIPQNFFQDFRFQLTKTTGGTEEITVLTSTALTISNNNTDSLTITFAAFDSGGSGGFTDTSTQYNILSPLLKFNPQTEGLSDGDSIGFLLAGGNATGVLRGNATISSASTDLIITPGDSSGTASTITGGLTLSSADGTLSNSIGYLNTVENSGYSSFMRTRVAAGQGIDGYGVGQQFSGTQSHGYGGYGADGAVLIYY